MLTFYLYLIGDLAKNDVFRKVKSFVQLKTDDSLSKLKTINSKGIKNYKKLKKLKTHHIVVICIY